MAQTATIVPMVSRDNAARLERVLKWHVQGLLVEARDKIACGIETTPQGEIFSIKFDQALEIEGCGEREVEHLVRSWLYVHYQDALDLMEYESSLRVGWILHFKVK
jgi:hypothetical protein